MSPPIGANNPDPSSPEQPEDTPWHPMEDPAPAGQCVGVQLVQLIEPIKVEVQIEPLKGNLERAIVWGQAI